MPSSEESTLNTESPPAKRYAKKMRAYRACDACRRKKVRCKKGPVPGGACVGCIAAKADCSYEEQPESYPKGYVQTLEKTNLALSQKVAMMEALLKGSYPANAPANAVTYSRADDPSMALETYEPSDEDEDDPKENSIHALTTDVNRVRLGEFYGKSSIRTLAKNAYDMNPDPSSSYASSSCPRSKSKALFPWEIETLESQQPEYHFPPPDLMKSLVDIYFVKVNSIMPLLHRPTFEAALLDDLHLRDPAFGGVVLLVCANGARMSHDPRALLPGFDNWNSAGWQWFSQVQLTSKVLLCTWRLYDLQAITLGCMYVQGGSYPHASWVLAGIGIRLALDVGAQRKNSYGSYPTADSELLKRAFWVLVFIERWASAVVGRPSAIQEEEFDLDPPLEIDDEYWFTAESTMLFKQPSGKNSRLSYFTAAIRLSRILGFALKTIYTTKKAKTLFGFNGADWEERTVVNFDSVLNQWANTLPDHLRWDPTMSTSDNNILDSAHLMCQFYHLQILVHRPFITSRKSSKLVASALAVCTNAARSIARIFVGLCSHFPLHSDFPVMPAVDTFMVPAFEAGVILLLAIWDARSSGNTLNPVKELEYVQTCLSVLECAHKRYQNALKPYKVLSDLVSSKGVDLTQRSVPPRIKRPRDIEEDDADVVQQSHDVPPHATDAPYAANFDFTAPQTGPLPLLSGELGHMPSVDPLWGMSGCTFDTAFSQMDFSSSSFSSVGFGTPSSSSSSSQWVDPLSAPAQLPPDLGGPNGYAMPQESAANPYGAHQAPLVHDLDALFPNSAPSGSVSTAVSGTQALSQLNEWDWYFSQLYGPKQQQQEFAPQPPPADFFTHTQ